MFYTTYFAQVRKIDPTANLVSIALKTPKGFPGRRYLKLAPSWEILEAIKRTGDEEAYTKQFMEQLSRLNVHEVAHELGEGAILVCYEGKGRFCHRHLVGDWLRGAGYQVKELEW